MHGIEELGAIKTGFVRLGKFAAKEWQGRARSKGKNGYQGKCALCS